MKHDIKDELIDELLSNYKNPEDLLGKTSSKSGS